MQFTSPGKKGYIIMIIIAVVIIAGYVFYRIKKDDFLDYKLQNIIKEKTNQLYNISYDSIKVNEIAGNLFIKNLHIEGDTLLQLQMINKKDTNASNMLFDIFIPTLEVKIFKTASALLSKQMECEEVIINNPKATLYLFPGQSKPKDLKKQQQELYKQILGNLRLIKASKINIVNGEVVAVDFTTKEVKFKTFNTNILLNDVAIDSTYNQDTSRTLFCKEIEINTEKVILGEKNKTAEISNFLFDTRTKVVKLARFEYDAFKNKGFFKSSLEGISLKGISWNGPVENSDIIIDHAIFDKGQLEVLQSQQKEKKTKPLKGKPILTGWIKSFSLNTLQVNSLTYINKPAEINKKAFTVKNNAFLIKNILLDRSSALDESLISTAKEIEIKNDVISLTSEDKLYNYRMQGLVVNTRERKVLLKEVAVTPLLNETEFSKKVKVQRDRYDIKFRNISCNNVNIEKLLAGEIVMDNITFINSTIHIFHDLSYPIDSASKQGRIESYPHQMLFKLKSPINIKNITLNKTEIEYKEKSAKSESSGKVRFTNATISINNISNAQPKSGDKLSVRFTSTFLDKIPVKGGFTFYLDQYKKGKFSADAIINLPFDGTHLNQITQPMALAKIDKGTINSFKFSITADTTLSKGNLNLLYENLKITLLKKKGSEYNKKDLISLLANALVKNNNKEGPGKRTATIELKPDKYRSFFSYVWKSVFTGLKQILTIKI